MRCHSEIELVCVEVALLSGMLLLARSWHDIEFAGLSQQQSPLSISQHLPSSSGKHGISTGSTVNMRKSEKAL
ncbi:MAG: hypothetical protein H6696_11180 [Deferribacteres bacterium]|nr:hypothetical protein [candidate division KSB1 bacterium]MCB9502495.1 hypothetical protein [Deferribacteres bacterium]